MRKRGRWREEDESQVNFDGTLRCSALDALNKAEPQDSTGGRAARWKVGKT